MTGSPSFYFQSYNEWRQALTQRCGIQLTPAYARERIQALQDDQNPTTRDFTAKYGRDYLKQVIRWFEQAERGH